MLTVIKQALQHFSELLLNNLWNWRSHSSALFSFCVFFTPFVQYVWYWKWLKRPQSNLIIQTDWVIFCSWENIPTVYRHDKDVSRYKNLLTYPWLLRFDCAEKYVPCLILKDCFYISLPNKISFSVLSSNLSLARVRTGIISYATVA